MALDINGYSTAAWGHAALPNAAGDAAAWGHAALPVRKRLDHRGPLSIDVSAAWYFITICAEGHRPWAVDNGMAACPHAAVNATNGRAACPHAAASHQINADVTFDEIARMILIAAQWYHEHGKWRLALFLVMPDHLHFIVHFPDGGVGTHRPTECGGVGTHRPTGMETVVGEFKKYLSRQLKIRFQRGFFDTRLRDDAHFSEKCNYILGNPVRKGLCAEPSDWPHVAVFSRVSDGRAACPHAAVNFKQFNPMDAQARKDC